MLHSAFQLALFLDLLLRLCSAAALLDLLLLCSCCCSFTLAVASLGSSCPSVRRCLLLLGLAGAWPSSSVRRNLLGSGLLLLEAAHLSAPSSALLLLGVPPLFGSSLLLFLLGVPSSCLTPVWSMLILDCPCCSVPHLLFKTESRAILLG